MLHVWLIICLFTPATTEAPAPVQGIDPFAEMRHELFTRWAINDLVLHNGYKFQYEAEDEAERAVPAAPDWMECRLGDTRRCPPSQTVQHLRLPPRR